MGKDGSSYVSHLPNSKNSSKPEKSSSDGLTVNVSTPKETTPKTSPKVSPKVSPKGSAKGSPRGKSDEADNSGRLDRPSRRSSLTSSVSGIHKVERELSQQQRRSSRFVISRSADSSPNGTPRARSHSALKRAQNNPFDFTRSHSAHGIGKGRVSQGDGVHSNQTGQIGHTGMPKTTPSIQGHQSASELRAVDRTRIRISLVDTPSQVDFVKSQITKGKGGGGDKVEVVATSPKVHKYDLIAPSSNRYLEVATRMTNLVILSIVSSILPFIGHYFGLSVYFLLFDSFLTSLCIYLTFAFSSKLYNNYICCCHRICDIFYIKCMFDICCVCQIPVICKCRVCGDFGDYFDNEDQDQDVNSANINQFRTKPDENKRLRVDSGSDPTNATTTATTTTTNVYGTQPNTYTTNLRINIDELEISERPPVAALSAHVSSSLTVASFSSGSNSNSSNSSNSNNSSSSSSNSNESTHVGTENDYITTAKSLSTRSGKDNKLDVDYITYKLAQVQEQVAAQTQTLAETQMELAQINSTKTTSSNERKVGQETDL